MHLLAKTLALNSDACFSQKQNQKREGIRRSINQHQKSTEYFEKKSNTLHHYVKPSNSNSLPIPKKRVIKTEIQTQAYNSKV